MGNNLGQQIYDILREGLSEITAGMILKEKCKRIGRTADTIMLEDLKNLIPLTTVRLKTIIRLETSVFGDKISQVNSI